MQYILHNILTVVNTFWTKKDIKNLKTKYQTKKTFLRISERFLDCGWQIF